MKTMNYYPELPHLPALLDEAAMRGILGAALPEIGIEQCRVQRVKYRPGRNCLITWQAKMEGRDREEILGYVMACRKGESARVFEEAARGAVHLAALDAVLWPFPQDRKLRGIEMLADPSRIEAEIVPEIARPNSEFKFEPIQYAAERSCTVRLRLPRERVTAYGKFYLPGEAGPVWRAIQAIWQSGGIAIPEPLAFHRSSESLWLKEVSGKSLDRFDPEDAATWQFHARTGATLAALHRMRIDGLPAMTAGDVARKLDAAVELVARARPDLEERLRRLADRLSANTITARSGIVATLHGDLHLKNIFVGEDGEIALIDLDNLCAGDPLIDLGSFIAYLYFRAMSGGRPIGEAERIAQAIVGGYGDAPDRPALNRQIALALISERAYRCLTRMKQDRFHLIGPLLDLAEGLGE